MAAYRRVYDSRHLQADCQEPRSAPNPALSNRVWASFLYSIYLLYFTNTVQMTSVMSTTPMNQDLSVKNQEHDLAV